MKKIGTETQKRFPQLKDIRTKAAKSLRVLAVKAGRISEFNGKAVSTIGSSQLFVEPDLVEARKLKEWCEREGRSAPCFSISKEFSGSGKVDVYTAAPVTRLYTAFQEAGEEIMGMPAKDLYIM
nr:unnamed protein product [Brassica oleracea]